MLDEFGQKTVATTQRAGWQTNMFVVHCLARSRSGSLWA